MRMAGRIMVVVLGVALGVTLILALDAGPALAAADEPQDLVVLSGRADVPRGRIAGEVVLFRGTATIAGVAQGDVVVVSGRAVVEGQVSGSVVNLGGPVLVAGSAQIRGDVIARKSVTVREGGQIAGSVSENVPFSLEGVLGVFGAFASWLAVSFSMLLLGAGLLWLAPRAAERVHDAGRGSPLRSAGIGLALFAGIPLVSLVLFASLVGVPLGVVLALSLGLLFFLSSTWSAWIVGRLVLNDDRYGRFVTFLAGWGILRVLGIVPWLGGISWLMSAIFGLGAMSVAMWRARSAAPVEDVSRDVPAVATPVAQTPVAPTSAAQTPVNLPPTRRSDRHRGSAGERS